MSAVRALEERDEPVWRALWRDYLAFYGTTRPEEVYRATFSRLIDPQINDCQGLIAERGAEAIGLANLIFHRHGWQIEPVCYLQDLYVTAAARGAGAGRALVEAVYATADASGAPSVYWLTQEDNILARRLYDRVGRATPFVKYVR